MVTALDPVAERLAASTDGHASLVIDWLEARHRRVALNRRAAWCTFGAWLTVTSAATVGCIVAVKFAADVRETFRDAGLWSLDGWSWEVEPLDLPMMLRVVPPLLGSIAALLIIGGLIAWSTGRFPGLGWARSAIDWADVSDGVSRLLAVGCTYPEAFQTAAKISRTRANREWLRKASERIESGTAQVSAGAPATSDVAVLEMLVEDNATDPSQRWQLAHQHFEDAARRRLSLLQGTLPVISTLLAGLLIWMSISATLGWMWGTIARMLYGMSP